jgi:hypothetical protein
VKKYIPASDLSETPKKLLLGLDEELFANRFKRRVVQVPYLFFCFASALSRFSLTRNVTILPIRS